MVPTHPICTHISIYLETASNFCHLDGHYTGRESNKELGQAFWKTQEPAVLNSQQWSPQCFHSHKRTPKNIVTIS